MAFDLTQFGLAKHPAPASVSMSERQPQHANGQPSDSHLAEAALAAQTCLRRSLGLIDARISCEVDGGKIILRGRVPTYSARQAARTLAEKACGCKVENRLGVVPYPRD